MKIILKNSTIGVCKNTELTMLSSTNKQVINQTGNITDVTQWVFNVDVYEVSEGDIIKIFGKGYYRNNRAAYALYNGTPESTTLVDIYLPISTSQETYTSVDTTITIPTGVTRLVITRYSNNTVQPESYDIYPIKIG